MRAPISPVEFMILEHKDEQIFYNVLPEGPHPPLYDGEEVFVACTAAEDLGPLENPYLNQLFVSFDTKTSRYVAKKELRFCYDHDYQTKGTVVAEKYLLRIQGILRDFYLNRNSTDRLLSEPTMKQLLEDLLTTAPSQGVADEIDNILRNISLINRCPKISYMMREADCLSKRGRTEAAAALYENVIELDPHYFDAKFLLGFIKFEQREFQAAAKLYSESVATDPSNVRAYLGLAICYRRLNDLQEEFKYFRRAFELSPWATQKYISVILNNLRSKSDHDNKDDDKYE
jgi:tetratricopeptide (TPR) repeat protein